MLAEERRWVGGGCGLQYRSLLDSILLYPRMGGQYLCLFGRPAQPNHTSTVIGFSPFAGLGKTNEANEAILM